MFRVRYLLGLSSALAVVLAAGVVLPRVAAALEKDSFNCPTDKVCFYDDPAFNHDAQALERRNPEVVVDPRAAQDASQVCVRLEHQKVPFLAGSARNNTQDAYLELFADDNCSTPVLEPEGGYLDPGGRAYEIIPQAQSFMAVDLSGASSVPESAQQQLREAGAPEVDDVDLDDADLLEDQETAAQAQREVGERGSSELAHERSRFRRLERLLLGDGREEGAAHSPGEAELEQLDLDGELHLHEVEQEVVGPVQDLGG